jgi:hypothetical protein
MIERRSALLPLPAQEGAELLELGLSRGRAIFGLLRALGFPLRALGFPLRALGFPLRTG